MSDQIPVDEQQHHPEHQQVQQPTFQSDQDHAQDAPSPDGNFSFIIHADNADANRERIEEMEREAAKLRELHSQLSNDASMSGITPQTDEEKREIDAKSIYIGNVDYGSTPLELQQHFSSCGIVNRVTIMMNKHTGQPKGFAYLEFSDVDAVNKAVATLDGSMFRDRQLKVNAKRTNIPGIGIKRGGAFRGGRGGGRGSFRGGPRGRGRGRGAFRGGARFTPY
ncbi:Polyadenylate-binding protein 2 [Spathaspora sp. JA1]|nr:Polyadenylate-binding protein 2 [Spathaspora sp. JA1]